MLIDLKKKNIQDHQHEMLFYVHSGQYSKKRHRYDLAKIFNECMTYTRLRVVRPRRILVHTNIGQLFRIRRMATQ